MRKILYLNENHALKTIDFNGLNVWFPEKAFVLSIIWDNVLLGPNVAGLTALEKYGMENAQFNTLVLAPSDFRHENTPFYMPDEYELGVPSTGGYSFNFSVPAVVPIYRNGIADNEALIIAYNATSSKHNVSVSSNYELQNYILNDGGFLSTDVIALGGLFFYFKAFITSDEYIYVNPKTNEFGFGDWYYWREKFSPEISHYAIGKGYLRQFENAVTGSAFIVSTTPIDPFVIFAT